MQSVSSRIWTRVAVSISCDDNHYTTGTSYKSRINIYKFSTDTGCILEDLTDGENRAHLYYNYCIGRKKWFFVNFDMETLFQTDEYVDMSAILIT